MSKSPRHIVGDNLPRLTATALVALVGIGALVAAPQPAHAKKLKNFVTDLFGGQGILLNDPGEGLEVANIGAASLQSLGTINSSISSNLGGSSLSSAVSGSLFDITQGMPVEATESLGPLVGERAETLGKGHFNAGLSFSHTTFKRVNNAPLSSLTATLTPQNCSPIGALGCDDVIQLNMNVKLERDVTALTAAYGITSRWDVGIIVPMVHVRATASANATLQDLGADGDTFVQTGTTNAHSQTGGDVTGLGDVVLRSKYNVLRDPGNLADLAIYNEIKTPTGDQNNLLGSGNTDVLGEVVLSKQMGAVAPHMNLGWQYAMGKGADRSNMRYVVGADARVSPSVTLGADIVGQYTDNGQHVVDVAIGGKWAVFDHSIVTAGILVPLNAQEGLRPDFAWSLRWEIGF